MKIKLTLLAFACYWPMIGHAESLLEFEDKLIKQYYQAEITSRVEADQYNSQIAEAISARVKRDPQSWSYTFPALVDKHMLDIYYSPDRKIKIYHMDTSSGGTMRMSVNLAQWQTASGTRTQLIEEDALIREIYQTSLAGRDTYLILSQAVASSCDGVANISAYHLATTKIVSTDIFQTKNQRLKNISVPFYCGAYPDDSPQLADRRTISEYLIRVDPQLQYVDIRLLDQKYAPQNKYLRYKKTASTYQYSGTVKR